MVTLSTTGVSSIRSSAGVAAVDVSGATVDLLVTFNVASALLTAQTVRGVVTVWQPLPVRSVRCWVRSGAAAVRDLYRVGR